MSNLEVFKKQAIQYLRGHRERYYPIAAIIREYVPRFTPGISIRQFWRQVSAWPTRRNLSRTLDGWQALRTGAYIAMPQSNPSAQPKLTSVAPQLLVRDLKASTDFFTAKLGFSIDFVYGKPPFYGQVRRDNVRLALRHVDRHFIPEDLRQRESLLSAEITVARADEIIQLFLTYKAADVPFAQLLRKEPWGAKTFIVKDPDGNLILFAGPAK